MTIKQLLISGLAGLLLAGSSCDVKINGTLNSSYTKACLGKVNLPLNLEAQFVDTYLPHSGPEYIYIGSKEECRFGEHLRDVGYLLVVSGYENYLGPVDIKPYRLIPINPELQAVMNKTLYREQGWTPGKGTFCRPIEDDELKKELVEAIFQVERVE
jgi:hypothetical protein